MNLELPSPREFFRAISIGHVERRLLAYSVLVGIAGNMSMSTGGKIIIDKLVTGLGPADYLPVPDDKNLSFVPKSVRMSKGKKSMANVPMSVKAPE